HPRRDLLQPLLVLQLAPDGERALQLGLAEPRRADQAIDLLTDRLGVGDQLVPDRRRAVASFTDALAKGELADHRDVVVARLASEAREVLHQRLEAALALRRQ